MRVGVLPVLATLGPKWRSSNVEGRKNDKVREDVARGQCLKPTARLSQLPLPGYLFRSSRNDVPRVASHSSSLFVQSQSQQARGSVLFSCRQVRRECASFTLSN